MGERGHFTTTAQRSERERSFGRSTPKHTSGARPTNWIHVGPCVRLGAPRCCGAVIADMWEEDGTSADDDFGIAGVLLDFGDGWAGKHEIVTHGSGSNSVAATVNVELQ